MLQNPKNTPVTLKMKDAELTHVHVSQNVPQRSPMEVEIDGAKTCQIQIAQSVPIASPLTWNLVGDPGQNKDKNGNKFDLKLFEVCGTFWWQQGAGWQ